MTDTRLALLFSVSLGIVLMPSLACPRTAAEQLQMQWSQGKAVGKGPIRFTYSPMQVEDIGAIIPMGLMVGAHVTPSDHQYYTPKDPNGGRYRYDVRAPADGFIVQIQHRAKFEGTSEVPREYDDYRVAIEHSGTFWSYFDLITRIDESILAQIKGGIGKGGNKGVRIPVKGGQVIGKVGGRTLDFGVVNTEVTLKGLLVPSHYDREPWKIHTVDPFDYFDEPLKGQLLQLNPRIVEPLGGKIDYDIDGRLVGNWFKENTNGYAGNGDTRGYWMGHLAIVYHHIGPSKSIVSLGDYEGKPRQFGVRGNAPDPATVSKDSGPVKYELINIARPSSSEPFEGADNQVQGVLLVQVLDGRKLKVETFVGKTAENVNGFTEAASLYER